MPFIIEKERDPLYKDGFRQGEKQGMKKVKETKIAIAKTLLKQGVDIEIIIKSTGLSKKEIEKLN